MNLKIKKERAQILIALLDELFPNPKIPLLHKDPYTLLIATLLSAQCTDARVNLVTPQLFALADNPESMVKLAPEQIEKIIRSCGLSPTKSRAIWQLSSDLITYHRGQVPASFEALEKLPGVGHKTASVVMAQAFHVPAFPVDTHIHKSAKLWQLSSAKSVTQTEKDLKKLFPEHLWIKLHLQIIYFSRKYRPSKNKNYGVDLFSSLKLES